MLVLIPLNKKLPCLSVVVRNESLPLTRRILELDKVVRVESTTVPEIFRLVCADKFSELKRLNNKNKIVLGLEMNFNLFAKIYQQT